MTIISSEEKGYDPLWLTTIIEKHVAQGVKRKYYRFRPARFYGGIATGDVVGCNLRCVFCWTGRARDDPRQGFWTDAYTAYRRLSKIALTHKYRFVRLSGGEPTIGFEHLARLLDYFEEDSRFIFILETNGILIGARREYARILSRYSILHVRVSIKACNSTWFHKLTGAKPTAFRYQVTALKNLLDYGVSVHAAIVVSYGDNECWKQFLEELSNTVGEKIITELEPEVIKLYGHVARRLRALGLLPERYTTI